MVQVRKSATWCSWSLFSGIQMGESSMGQSSSFRTTHCGDCMAWGNKLPLGCLAVLLIASILSDYFSDPSEEWKYSKPPKVAVTNQRNHHECSRYLRERERPNDLTQTRIRIETQAIAGIQESSSRPAGGVATSTPPCQPFAAPCKALGQPWLKQLCLSATCCPLSSRMAQ